MIAAALVLGCTLFAVGSALWVIRGPAAELQAAGAALIGIGGAAAALGGDQVGETWRFALDPAVGVDRLSGWLLAVIGFVAAASMLASRTFGDRNDGILAGPFVLALVLVAVARDPSTLLAGWELMTLVPVVIVLVRRADDQSRRSMFVYLAVTHLGGVALWLAVLLAGDASAGRQSVVALLAVAGCAAKAGLVPLHVWLPRAHPIAPPHISALMSGVMVKVALYVLARFLLEWTPLASDAAAIAVIVLGAVSGVVGGVYAVLQADLKRLLAFSTVENVGVIALALGAATLLQHAGNDTAARLALGAALLHATAHAAAKALAFISVGAIDRDAGSVRLNKLGGVLAAAPWTGGALLLALVTLAGLPPLAGFAGEWAVAQALLASARTGGVGHAVLGVAAVAALAATAGLAVYAAVTVTGLVLLGRPRTPAAMAATDAARPVRVALGVLGGGIAVVSLFPRRDRARHDRRRVGRRLAGLARPAGNRRAAAARPGARAGDRVRGAAVGARPVGVAGADLGLRTAARSGARVVGGRVHEAGPDGGRGRARAGAGGGDGAGRADRPAHHVPQPRAGPHRGPRLPAVGERRAPWRRRREPPADRAPARLRRLHRGDGDRAADRRAQRVDRMTGAGAASVVVQVAGVALAPLCVGSVQSLKALLTGRRGAGPLQPYRELRRLWASRSCRRTGPGRSIARPRPSPPRPCSAALVVVPIGAAAPDGPAGRDALVVAGLLAAARLAVGLGAFDTRNGFALQGVSRDLLFAVAGDALLAATLGALAVAAGSSDLRTIAAATAGGDVWRGPAQVLLSPRSRLVDGCRDRPPADRQPRHAPRADDDPRGPAAGVRRT